MTVSIGLERFLNQPAAWVQPVERVGLLSNPTGVDRQLRSTVDLLHQRDDVRLVRLYGPEHGIRGDAQARVAVDDGADPRAGLPVTSLYAKTHGTRAEAFTGIDVLLIDIQDIGARYYTYHASANSATRHAHKAGTRVVVLDRPNPIAWIGVWGNRVADGAGSIVGLEGLPVTHGATLAEMLCHLARVEGREEPEVVSMIGWDRTMRWAETGLLWVLPSPNLPTPDSVHLYPATCLIEGTSLSEGRGTTLPFEMFGAPGIDHYALADRLSNAGIDGYLFRPTTFVPTFSKHVGAVCNGVQIHPIDGHHPNIVAFGPKLLQLFRDVAGDAFSWNQVGERYFIDRLAGGPLLRATINAAVDIAALATRWESGASAFFDDMAPSLLYGPLIRQGEGQ